MPTESRKHQIVKDKTVQGVDGYDGLLFQAFSRGETLQFHIRFTANPIIFDFSGYQFFASMTAVGAESCGSLGGSEFAEAALEYIGQSSEDANIYLFDGKITDEQTIQLPDGQQSVVGAIKMVSPLGDSEFVDQALITVFPCRNPRLEQD